MATLLKKGRTVGEIVECIRSRIDYNEFSNLAPHLDVKLANDYYKQISDAETSTFALVNATALATKLYSSIISGFKDRTLVESFDLIKEFLVTLLWKFGEADVYGKQDLAQVYLMLYRGCMNHWREEVLSDDTMREAFTYAYDEEAWDKNVAGRVYWVKKTREIAKQLIEEET